MSPYRVWIWPHLISLDAPMIAVVWQLLLARTVAPIPPVQTFILGLSVWLIYALDRVLDASRPPGPKEAPRHRFAREHRAPLTAAIAVVLCVDLVLAFGYLETIRLERGLIVLTLVGLHFYWTHRRRRPWAKELWIGLVFSLGVWLPAMASAPSAAIMAEATLFAALCTWNCVAIEAWERTDLWQGNWHASTRWLVPRLRPAAAAIAVGGLALYALTRHPAAGAETLTGVLYWLLQAKARGASADVLRLAVDVCLLTPVLFR